ncbi:MAG: acetoacetate--CoA ligase [Anaerolineae bacterium]
MQEPIQEGTLLWEPSSKIIEEANLTRFMHWLADQRSVQVNDYDSLHQWSVEHLVEFWQALAEYCEIQFTRPPSTILSNDPMPRTRWFVGAELNYTENIFRKMTDERPMLYYKAEDSPLIEMSWHTVYQQVNQLASALRALGVRKGDRVVNFMPNRPESLIALLATASIGAIWSSCSPDFGARSVLDRFSQIEPRILFAVDGYNHGGRTYDRREIVAELQASLPSLQQTILVPHISADMDSLHPNTVLWDNVLANSTPPERLHCTPVEFEHPLWVLYSSGTTGLPKPIVHSHGGITLEHHKATILHNDLKPGDRFFWYTSTGWMMWNYLVGALFSGATILLYEGSPGFPNLNILFEFAHHTNMTYFGTSAAFISACMNAQIAPEQEYDLSRIRAVGSTGSPLPPNGFGWIYEHLNDSLALESLSGGTDLCTAFVGGARIKPIYAGEIQGASLGADVQAYDNQGKAVIDEVGELVITRPMPSMPIYFWSDPGMARYTHAYFSVYAGVWRHGDWIKFNQRGGCVIYGRSDATINRQGIRMGTSEIYQAVEALPEIDDSLVIDLELLGRDSYMVLFVVLREGESLTDTLQQAIKHELRTQVSPRHIPDEIVAIDAVPYTLSGKKMEVPIRKILLGEDPQTAINRGAMRNPDSIAYFVQFADRLNNK